MYLLGYDIGSSTIKAAVINVDTNETIDIVQYPETEMDMISRQSGWAEQQPEVWWQNLVYATRKLVRKSNVDVREIRGIGIGYQMHGLVLIDKDHHVLRPSIIWCDSRAVAIGNNAFKEIGEGHCLKRFLNSPGNFTASKLKWVKDNEPDVYCNSYRFLLPGDYIALMLTGEPLTTISGLSEGIFWDYKAHELSGEIINYYDIDHELIPELTPTFGIQGRLTREAADITGLMPGTPVSYRAGDQPNNALSLNVLNPGEIAATSGTSGVVYGIVDRPLYDKKSRVNAFAHVNYEDNFDRIGILLCLNGAGIQYSWMRHQVARSGRSYTDMERMVSTVPVGSDGLCILPFGNGAERMLENRNVNSHIFNIEFNRHTRAHLYRAALEGVACSFVHGVNILKDMGLDVDVMRVGNDNMFQSEIFSTTIATLLNCHIEVVDTTGAVGAARAAGVATGAYGSLEEALMGIRPSVVHEPRLNHAVCKQAYNYWLSCLERALIENPKKPDQNRDLSTKIRQLESELDKKNSAITTSSLQVQSGNDLLQGIKRDLQRLLDSPDADPQAELKKVIKKIDHHVSGGDWESFEQHFELVYSDFFKKLKINYPDLSTSEIRLSALLKMRMTTKEIATQLNLSVRGVETRRYRLRKKMQLKKEVGLEDYLDQI